MSIRYDDVEAGAALPPASYPVSPAQPDPLLRGLGRLQRHPLERPPGPGGRPARRHRPRHADHGPGRRLVTDWAGPGAVVTEFDVRFSAPVLVPDDDAGATIEVGGQVREKLGDGRVALTLTARSAGEKVLARARAVVRLRD